MVERDGGGEEMIRVESQILSSIRKIPRMSSPVPIRRNRARAISAETIAVRRRLCERPAVAARLWSFKLVLTSVRDALSAGAIAQSTAETSETARAKSNTFQSRRKGTALVASLKV